MRPKVTITVELDAEQVMFEAETTPITSMSLTPGAREARHARLLLAAAMSDAERWLTARAGGE